MFRTAGYSKNDNYLHKSEFRLGRTATGTYRGDAHRFKSALHIADNISSERMLSPVHGAPMRAKDTLLASILRNSKSLYTLKQTGDSHYRLYNEHYTTRANVNFRNSLLPSAKKETVAPQPVDIAKRVPSLVGRLVSVEIECYHNGHYPDERGLTTVGGDGSLDSGGVEVKRMTWASNGRLMGLLSLEKQLRGYTVNKKCGLHVHIDARHLPTEPSETRMLHTASETYNRLTQLYPMLKKLVSKSRLNNKYCRWVNNNPNADNYNARCGRYAAINFEAYNKYKTIEFRCANGSTNVVKIESWALLCRHLFDHCANKNNHVPTNWSAFLAILPAWMASWCILRHQKLHGNVGSVDDRVASALDFSPSGTVE